MKIAYEGFTTEGQAVQGIVVAADPASARQQLRGQGIFAVRVSAAADASSAGARRIAPDRLASTLRQLSLLVATGTPLVEALVAVERQADDARWSATLGELRKRVEEGAALSEAMAAMPHIFDPICRTMAAAGESAGILDRMLGDLAELYRRQSRVRKAVLGAIAYPAVVVAASVVVLVGLVTMVLPKFRDMFESIQAPIPTATAFLMSFGETVRDHWGISLVVALAVLCGLVWAARSAVVRSWIIEQALGAPGVGSIVRSLATAQFVRCLGLLLESRVGLLDAIRLTADAMHHPAYVRLLKRAEEAVSHGEPFAAVLADERCIEPSVRQAVASGERSGRLGAVLSQLGRYLDEDNEVAVKGLARAVEPLLLAVLGVMIGFVAISLFLPLFDVAASAGGGGAR
jgi:type II secretory pathway component PulF